MKRSVPAPTALPISGTVVAPQLKSPPIPNVDRSLPKALPPILCRSLKWHLSREIANPSAAGKSWTKDIWKEKPCFLSEVIFSMFYRQ